jgi:hypothetical protein
MKISVVMPVCAYPDPGNFEGGAHPHLRASLDSIVNGGHRDIEILIGGDGTLPKVSALIEAWGKSRNLDAAKLRYVEYSFSGRWGNPQRNKLLQMASGDVVCFQDQDDVFFPNALADVARVFEQNPLQPAIFRMAGYSAYDKCLREPWIIWQKEGILGKGQIGGHMLVIPNNKPLLGKWNEEVYEGDWHFINETLQNYAAKGIAPNWRGEFISIIRPWAKVK